MLACRGRSICARLPDTYLEKVREPAIASTNLQDRHCVSQGSQPEDRAAQCRSVPLGPARAAGAMDTPTRVAAVATMVSMRLSMYRASASTYSRVSTSHTWPVTASADEHG